MIDFYRYEKEEREKKLRRLREDQQRMAMAQRGRGGMMQRGGPMRGGMIRGRGGVMLSRGGIKRPLQGHTGPRPSFQYRDGSFICDLCKKSFSDGNDMVSSSRLAIFTNAIILSTLWTVNDVQGKTSWKDFQHLWENFSWKDYQEYTFCFGVFSQWSPL